MPAYKSQVAKTLKANFRLQAKELAQGLRAGNHRAARKGAGVEFAGHRPYTPGDDLRYLDRHALLRHGRHLIRQFLTDTERELHVVVDATPSMHYRTSHARREPAEGQTQTKVEVALLLAGALAVTTRRSGDSLGLMIATQAGVTTLPARATPSAYEEVQARLESEYARAKDTTSAQTPKTHASNKSAATWEPLFTELGSRAARGSVVVLLSDFLDFGQKETDAVSSLFVGKRNVRAVQILTKDELTFPFDGSLRFLDPESGKQVETEARSAREKYLSALESLSTKLARSLRSRGGLFLRLQTDEPLTDTALALVRGRSPE